MKKSNWDIDYIDMRTAPSENEKKKGFLNWLKRNWKKILVISIALYGLIVGYGV